MAALLLGMATPLGAGELVVVPKGAEFDVDSFSTSSQRLPSVSSDAEGNFVVVWSRREGNDAEVFARRFASGGEALGGEFRVNSYTAFVQGSPSVSSDADGDFVVVWTSVRPGRQSTEESSASVTRAETRPRAGVSSQRRHRLARDSNPRPAATRTGISSWCGAAAAAASHASAG